jgi:hypothetical protein
MNASPGARADLSCRGDTDTDSAASLCRNTKKRDLSAMLLLLDDDVHEDAASCAQQEEERDPYDYFYGVVDDDIATAATTTTTTQTTRKKSALKPSASVFPLFASAASAALVYHVPQPVPACMEDIDSPVLPFKSAAANYSSRAEAIPLRVSWHGPQAVLIL